MAKKQYSDDVKQLAYGIYVETISKIKAKAEYENAFNSYNPSKGAVDVKFGVPQCTHIADFALDAAQVFMNRAYPVEGGTEPVPLVAGLNRKVTKPTPAS